MIHLIYSERGWVVPATTFGISLISELITRYYTNDEDYYQNHGLPFAAALTAAALIIYLVNKNIYAPITDSDGNILSQPEFKWMDHSFFFINIKLWFLLLLIISIALVAFRGI